MLLNVWGVVWRMQKKLIRWTEANATQGTAMPPEAAQVMRLTMLAARLNLRAVVPPCCFSSGRPQPLPDVPGEVRPQQTPSH